MFQNILRKLKNTDKDSRSVLINILGAFLVKGGGIIVALFTTPAYIRYFDDNTALGLWYTLLSVITCIINFDLGIGNGLRNRLTDSLSKNDTEKSKEYISSAYCSVGLIVLSAGLIALPLFKFFNWNNVFNIAPETVSAEALLKSVRIIFFGILLQFFLNLITSVLYAVQKSAVNNALNFITAVLTLVYASFAPSYDNSANLIAMSVVHMLAVNIPLLTATLILFSSNCRSVRPSLKQIRARSAGEILKLGGSFFLVQIFYMAIINTNEYLITTMTESKYVVDYQVYFRICTLIGSVVMMSVTPVWSAVTKALAEKKYQWIYRIYKILLIFSGAGCLVEFLLIPVLQNIVDLWLGSGTITVSTAYALIFAVLGSSIIINSVIACFANGMGLLKTQLYGYGIGALIKIPVSLLLNGLSDSWIGIVITTALIMCAFDAIQFFSLRKQFRKMSGMM